MVVDIISMFSSISNGNMEYGDWKYSDMISPDYNPLAKKIKDMAAAAVLFTSIFSVIIGTVILLPKVLVLFNLF